MNDRIDVFRTIASALLMSVLAGAFGAPADAKCLIGSDVEDARLGPLRTITPLRAGNAADRERAARFLTEAKAALIRYRDRRLARSAGYDDAQSAVVDGALRVWRQSDAPGWDWPSFDVRRPAALIDARSTERHPNSPPVGALYQAVSNTTGESLDDLVPLSFARWVRRYRRCALPKPDVWTLEVFPFEHTAARIWRIATSSIGDRP